MNERIQELVLKARGQATSDTKDGGNCFDVGLFHKKFAELIVAECIEQVKGQYVPVIEDKEMMKDTHWDGYVQCGVDSVVAIREHFYGVEE